MTRRAQLKNKNQNMNTSTESIAAVKAAPRTAARRVTFLNIDHEDFLLPDDMTTAEKLELLAMLERCKRLETRWDATTSNTYKVKDAPSVGLSTATRTFDIEEAV